MAIYTKAAKESKEHRSMNAIEVRNLRKEFTVPRDREGMKGALRDLFKSPR